MPFTWYDGASEGSFRFRINDGNDGQESPEPAYTETKASILRRYIINVSKLYRLVLSLFFLSFKSPIFKHFLILHRRSTISKLRQEDDKQNSTFGSRRNYSRLSLMNSTNSLHYQREMLGRGFGGPRRHWSLSDIPRTRVETMSEQRWNNPTSEDLPGRGLTRR